MKIKLIPTPKSPEYEFSGNVITATYNDEIEIIDLTKFPQNGKWQGGELENITELSLESVIRDVFHNGELHVILPQKIPFKIINKDNGIKFQTGHWVESDWIDSNDYDPNELYIKEVRNEG